MTWTLQYIEQLAKTGKIRGFVDNQSPQKKTRIPAAQKMTPEKNFVAMHVEDFCKAHSLELIPEHKFSERKFRFDWCIPEKMIAIEYNGIMSRKSRHTTVTGYSRDMTKINLAQSLGWTVYQYTPLNYEEIKNDLKI